MQEIAAVEVIMGTLAGLEAVHAVNLVHRDMKPDNVIMHDRGDGFKIPKIVDFGMAKGLRSANGTAMATQMFMTEGDMVAGTPEYMSPEQWAGVEKDMYARASEASEASDRNCCSSFLIDLWRGSCRTVVLCTPLCCQLTQRCAAVTSGVTSGP